MEIITVSEDTELPGTGIILEKGDKVQVLTEELGPDAALQEFIDLYRLMISSNDYVIQKIKQRVNTMDPINKRKVANACDFLSKILFSE